MDYHVGQKVHWNDPGILDYDEEDREKVLARVFLVHDVDNRHGIAYIVEEDDGSEAEVYTNELEPIYMERDYQFMVNFTTTYEVEVRASSPEEARELAEKTATEMFGKDMYDGEIDPTYFSVDIEEEE